MQSARLNRYLPHVAVATFAVLGLPAIAASAIQAAVGLPAVMGIVLAVALSLAVARAGSAFWMRRPASRDLVFADLMVWGWLRRMRSERRLAEATRVLGGTLSVGDRAEVLEQLAKSLEARDLYTYGHSKRVTRHAEMIARGMGLDGDEVAKVRTAAAVHDVGKIFTPGEVLRKPGALTDVEFEIVKRHAADGAGMVAELGERDVTAMVRHHHERLDGSGYPEGLRARDIATGARIIAVADTFDAMTSTRPYRRACSHRRAMDVLAADAGTRLDADAVAAFRAAYTRPWPVAWSSLLVTVPQRLVSWAGGALQGGAATLGAAAVIGGGAMIGPAATGEAHPEATAKRPATAGAAAPARPGRDLQPARPPAVATPQVATSAPGRRVEGRSKRPKRPRAKARPPDRADQPTSRRPEQAKPEHVQPNQGKPPKDSKPSGPRPVVPRPPPVHDPKVRDPKVRAPKLKVPKPRPQPDNPRPVKKTKASVVDELSRVRPVAGQR